MEEFSQSAASALVYETKSILSNIGDDGITRTILKENEDIDVHDAELVHQWVHANHQGKPIFLMVVLEQGSSLTPEVREWMASDTRKSRVGADAIIVKSLALKIIANYYLKFNKPSHPTKIFNHENVAELWLKEQQEKMHSEED